jgi:phosphopantothenoylcysteine decarboxylase/phosphopantothenate--cysteine ligase
MSLNNKKIVVGVSGSIAAYKAVLLVRELIARGAEVRVVMTPSATRFIGAATFSGITGKPALVDLWDASYAGEVHVDLARWADAIVVAPATANLLARAASGLADDALLATLSCARSPVLYAPAMHERMWMSAPTKRNVEQLVRGGARIVGPVRGALASGEVGWGRLEEPALIADAVASALRAMSTDALDLTGKTVLISAGPTIEDIDPVRYITNRSSGRMGFALASAARDRGAEVVLVCGPTQVPPPSGIERIDVRSALDMKGAIDRLAPRCDIVVMTAAVADYRPAHPTNKKIKKSTDALTLELVKNPDILAGLGAARDRAKRPVLIGFAMETGDMVAHARKKLVSKQVDLVVANEAAVGFGRDDTQATLVWDGGEEATPPITKLALAHRIFDHARALLGDGYTRASAAQKPKAESNGTRVKTKSRPALPLRGRAKATRRKGRG